MKRQSLLLLKIIFCVNLLIINPFSIANALTPSGTIPSPRTIEYPWMSIASWNKMHAEDVAVAGQGDIDILFVGDSITAGLNDELLNTYFPQLRRANFGIGGDHTGNLLWRLQHDQANHLKPKVVILLIGVNNFGHLNETPAQVFAGIEATVNLLRNTYPKAKILVNGIFPFEESPQSEKRGLVMEANKMIATLNDDHSIFVKNYGPLLLQADGSINKDIMGDFLHPTKEGYQRWLQAMQPDIQKLMKIKEPKMLTIDTTNAHIASMGRTHTNADQSLSFGYPGVSFFVNFEGKSLLLDASSSSNQSYLEVIVDGESTIIKLPQSRQTIPLVSNKKSAKHRIEIIHRTETWQGVVTLKQFSTDGKFLKPARLPQRKILLLGDSVTSGEAIERIATDKKNSSWWNPRLSYGMLLAKELNAQVHLVSCGGRGLIRSWNNKTDEQNLPDFYQRSIADAAYPASWNHTQYDPDLIIIAIGTNDFSQSIPDSETFIKAYVSFLTTITNNHKHAQVVLTEGAIVSGERKTTLIHYIAEAIKRVNNSRIHRVAVSHYPGDETDGHPTKEQHAAMAKELTPQLQKILQW
ncbi:MAG: GDSL-type esterase/lipase family protein [Pseudomonadota bacterium]